MLLREGKKKKTLAVLHASYFQQAVPFLKHKKLDMKTKKREYTVLTNGSLEMGFQAWVLFPAPAFTLSLHNT
jgi:hypothetical protein